jgi:hypothetical protein
MRFMRPLLLAALAVLPAAPVARAQGIHLTPMLGAYKQASDFQTLKGEAQSIDLKRENTMALGANLELGALRGTLAYVTNAKLSREGVSGDVGEGKLLLLTGDLVVRPIPRILGLQPYLLGGAGVKRNDYSFKDDGFAADFPKNETDFALHFGVGADLMFGGLGVMAEVGDFVSYADRKFGRHDAVGMVGLRLRLF